MKKLDVRGVAHDVLLVAFVVVFAVAGVGYLVASHANSCSKNSGGAGLGACTAPLVKGKSGAGVITVAGNPNSCTINTQNSNPSKNGRNVLLDYRDLQDVRNGKTQLLRDHILTLVANDVRMAGSGYCRWTDHGWAYATNVRGVANLTPLYQYYNGTTKHHYYTTTKLAQTGPNSIDTLNQLAGSGWHAAKIAAWVSSQPVSSGPNATVEMTQLYNPGNKSFYYAAKGADLERAINDALYNSANGPGGKEAAFYVWANK